MLEQVNFTCFRKYGYYAENDMAINEACLRNKGNNLSKLLMVMFSKTPQLVFGRKN